ncbi:hypothetical protein HMPREF3145_03165 [Corynebacterium sp. HMSC05C01]|uniref:DUF262 domain-containing protein n=1 Tax=Corynebacterium sp. HMSC05C01 TaxID=1581113 RepID=UPI0008A15DA5|nr:DUF262 domain-containing protein [Corynebacterium sp. HMSC05C01]OFT71484.1 hypothetical protein HMPREF3145_03165 [Corynebacterium sp. HMSC05C01]
MSTNQPSQRDVEKAEAQIVEQSKRIEFYLTEYSVEMLALKVHEREFVVPDYQRNFTWEEPRKSRFIESLIMGLPIPFLFFWEMPNGKLEIVDGSQRLRTIEEFIYGNLRLGELKTLDRLSGFRFEDLPASRRRKIKNRSVRGIVLNEHADQAARLDMFQRINTGSKNANPAEIRRGALAGPFMSFVIELSKCEKFHSLAPITKKRKDEREYEELITRFFAYGDGLEKYRDNPSEFLYEYVEKMNGAFEKDRSSVERYHARAEQVLDFVSRNFPNGFKKSEGSSFTPRSRFEAISIGVYKALKESPSIGQLTADEVAVASWLDSREFKNITSSDGANARGRLEGRINFVRDKLVGNN